MCNTIAHAFIKQKQCFVESQSDSVGSISGRCGESYRAPSLHDPAHKLGNTVRDQGGRKKKREKRGGKGGKGRGKKGKREEKKEKKMKGSEKTERENESNS